MIYYFQHYRFDSEKLILSKDEQILNLRNNEAKLLHFFLNNPYQVLSKEHILDAVWVDKIVGEQAVFQAISNLRQQFGEDAIRTFPKKGYQWQIALEDQAKEERDAKTKEIIAPVTHSNKSSRYVLLSAGVMVVLISLLFWIAPWKSTTTSLISKVKTEIPVRPIHLTLKLFQVNAGSTEVKSAIAIQKSLTEQLQKKPGYVISDAKNSITETQLLASPQYYWRELQSGGKDTNTQSGTTILLSGRLSQLANMYQLTVQIQGKENRWLVHLQAQDLAALNQQLVMLLNRILPVNLLWESKDQRLVNAQLQLLLNDSQNDLNIQKNLLLSLINIGDLQTAQMRSDHMLQQAEQQQNLAQQIAALHAQARIAFSEFKFEQARTKLDRALSLAELSQDAFLQAQSLERYFTIFYEEHRFDPLEEHLLRALALARSIKAQALEANLMLGLTIASYKFSLTTKQNYYFTQTHNLFTQLQLAPDNFADLEFLSGLNSKDIQQSEKLFLQALSRFKPEQKILAKERIQTQLVKLYLKQNRYQAALALLPNMPNLSNAENLLKATILTRQKNIQAALVAAEQVFQASNLSGEYLLALDAALLLAQLYQSQHKTEQVKIYSSFIQKNATKHWLKLHEAELSAINP